ncbi:MAG TPA: DUF4189 domain-containing protein [Mycobacterium sp.]|nr:DUF4189 domain-containing protein [Mycobacterium sp.]HPZ93695.1 DUF4189 domain-containing protein [Mycobacterium sp.]HQE13886.1 DUF4189 domain-containing protein [Mycobacterium sp.]
MGNFRLLSSIAAAGVIAAGISTGIAWAGGPGGVVEDPEDIYDAVGTGTFDGGLVGFHATGDTFEEASEAVLAECRADGGMDCTVDEYSNDNLCIVSVADDVTDVVAGGAGPTVEAAKADAVARAAANGTPLDASAAIVISACP